MAETDKQQFDRRVRILQSMLAGEPQKHPVMAFVNGTGVQKAMYEAAERAAAERAAAWAAHNQNVAAKFVESRRAAAEANTVARGQRERNAAKRAEQEAELKELLKHFNYDTLGESMGYGEFIRYLQDDVIGGPLSAEYDIEKAKRVLALLDSLSQSAGGRRRRREKTRRRQLKRKSIRRKSRRAH